MSLISVPYRPALVSSSGRPPVARQFADVGGMRMARNDRIDRRIELGEDRHDVAIKVGAALVVVATSWSARPGGSATRSRRHLLAFSAGIAALAVAASSAKVRPATPAGVTSVSVSFSVMPMKPICTGPKSLIAVPGNSVDPSSRSDIGGEEFEVRPVERLDRAGRLGGMLGAAAALHPQQFGAALVELVIADRVKLDPDLLHRLDRRLVEEQRGDQRRGADHVAGRDGYAVTLAGPQHLGRAEAR